MKTPLFLDRRKFYTRYIKTEILTYLQWLRKYSMEWFEVVEYETKQIKNRPKILFVFEKAKKYKTLQTSIN